MTYQCLKKRKDVVLQAQYVHKYVGYLAEQGLALQEIKEKAEALVSQIKSIGMALTPPMVPTTGQYGFDINDEDIEIG